MAGALGVLGGAVRRVTIRTNLSPAVEVDPFAAPGGSTGGPGVADVVGQLLQPAFDVETAAGRVVVAPWGEPSPLRGALALVALAAAGWVIFRAARG